MVTVKKVFVYAVVLMLVGLIVHYGESTSTPSPGDVGIERRETDPCTNNYGDCQDVCTNNNGVAVCSCSIRGYTLGTDGKSCKVLTASATIPILRMVDNFKAPGNEITGVTLTREGDLAITRFFGTKVHIFSKNGSFIREFSIPAAGYTCDIIRNEDSYFVSDLQRNYVHFVGEDGRPHGRNGQIDIGSPAIRLEFRYRTLWATSILGLHEITFDATYHVTSSKVIAPADESSLFTLPTGLALLSDRVILLSGFEHSIHIFDFDGNRMSPPVGKTGHADGEFHYPKDVTTDEYDRMYIADSFNYRVSLFSKNGTFLKHLLTKGKEIAGEPTTMFYEDGFLYLATSSEYMLYIFEVQQGDV